MKSCLLVLVISLVSCNKKEAPIVVTPPVVVEEVKGSWTKGEVGFGPCAAMPAGSCKIGDSVDAHDEGGGCYIWTCK